MYEILDNAILNVITGSFGNVKLLRIQHNSYVNAEASRLEELTNRKSFRIIDGRLQALRKQGKIKFDSKLGWTK